MQSVASQRMYSCSAYKHSSSSATVLLLCSTLKWPRNASLLCHIASRPLQVRAWGLLSSDGTPGGNEGDHLVAEFMHHVISTRQSWPLEGRTPTPLMPPHTVVKVQMDALMRNDWPEENSGIRTAFLFSKPNKVEEMHVGQKGDRRQSQLQKLGGVLKVILRLNNLLHISKNPSMHQ